MEKNNSLTNNHTLTRIWHVISRKMLLNRNLFFLREGGGGGGGDGGTGVLISLSYAELGSVLF